MHEPYEVHGSTPGHFGASQAEDGLATWSASVAELPGDEADAATILCCQLHKATKPPDGKYGSSYIIQEDLDAFWSDREQTATIVHLDSTDEVVDVVHNRMRKVVSVLLLIGAKDCLRNFKQCLFAESGPIITDEDLPLQQREALSFLDPAFQDTFLWLQYTFFPSIIAELDAAPNHLNEDVSSLPIPLSRASTIPSPPRASTIRSPGLEADDRSLASPILWTDVFGHSATTTQVPLPFTQTVRASRAASISVSDFPTPRTTSLPISPRSDANGRAVSISLPLGNVPIGTMDSRGSILTDMALRSHPPVAPIPQTRGRMLLSPASLSSCRQQNWTLQVERVKRGRIEVVELSKDDRIVGVSISPTGRRVACLTDDAVYLYDSDSPTVQSTIPLPKDGPHQKLRVAVGESEVVVWGLPKKQGKKVLFHRTGMANFYEGPAPNQVASLKDVQISANGSIAFVCSKYILYTTLARFEESNYQPRWDVDRDRTIAAAAFNPSGTMLYAWHCGDQGEDRLEKWQIVAGNIFMHHLTTRTTRGFARAREMDKPRLFPYNSIDETLIEAPAGAIFDSRVPIELRNRLSATVPRFLAACVYGDQSLLTIESKGIRGSCTLTERQIHDVRSVATRECLGDPTSHPLKAVRATLDEPPAVAMADDGMTVKVIVCSIRGEVEVLKFE